MVITLTGISAGIFSLEKVKLVRAYRNWMIVFICTVFSKVANFRPKNNWLKISQMQLSVRYTLSHGWKIAEILGINAYYYELNLRKFAIIPKNSCGNAQLGGRLRGASGWAVAGMPGCVVGGVMKEAPAGEGGV